MPNKLINLAKLPISSADLYHKIQYFCMLSVCINSTFRVIPKNVEENENVPQRLMQFRAQRHVIYKKHGHMHDMAYALQ